MSSNELIRAEWAIGLKDAVPKEELIPCFLFEAARDCARHRELCHNDRGALFTINIPEGFDSPYLLLSPEKRKFLGTFFWSVAGKDLGDLGKSGRSDHQIQADVKQLLYRRAQIRKNFTEKPQEGRAALPAKVRTNLKAEPISRLWPLTGSCRFISGIACPTFPISISTTHSGNGSGRENGPNSSSAIG